VKQFRKKLKQIIHHPKNRGDSASAVASESRPAEPQQGSDARKAPFAPPVSPDEPKSGAEVQMIPAPPGSTAHYFLKANQTAQAAWPDHPGDSALHDDQTLFENFITAKQEDLRLPHVAEFFDFTRKISRNDAGGINDVVTVTACKEDETLLTRDDVGHGPGLNTTVRFSDMSPPIAQSLERNLERQARREGKQPEREDAPEQQHAASHVLHLNIPAWDAAPDASAPSPLMDDKVLYYKVIRGALQSEKLAPSQHFLLEKISSSDASGRMRDEYSVTACTKDGTPLPPPPEPLLLSVPVPFSILEPAVQNSLLRQFELQGARSQSEDHEPSGDRASVPGDANSSPTHGDPTDRIAEQHQFTPEQRIGFTRFAQEQNVMESNDYLIYKHDVTREVEIIACDSDGKIHPFDPLEAQSNRTVAPIDELPDDLQDIARWLPNPPPKLDVDDFARRQPIMPSDNYAYKLHPNTRELEIFAVDDEHRLKRANSSEGPSNHTVVSFDDIPDKLLDEIATFPQATDGEVLQAFAQTLDELPPSRYYNFETYPHTRTLGITVADDEGNAIPGVRHDVPFDAQPSYVKRRVEAAYLNEFAREQNIGDAPSYGFLRHPDTDEVEIIALNETGRYLLSPPGLGKPSHAVLQNDTLPPEIKETIEKLPQTSDQQALTYFARTDLVQTKKLIPSDFYEFLTDGNSSLEVRACDAMGRHAEPDGRHYTGGVVSFSELPSHIRARAQRMQAATRSNAPPRVEERAATQSDEKGSPSEVPSRTPSGRNLSEALQHAQGSGTLAPGTPARPITPPRPR